MRHGTQAMAGPHPDGNRRQNGRKGSHPAATRRSRYLPGRDLMRSAPVASAWSRSRDATTSATTFPGCSSSPAPGSRRFDRRGRPVRAVGRKRCAPWCCAPEPG